jgi:hypothetical protein
MMTQRSSAAEYGKSKPESIVDPLFKDQPGDAFRQSGSSLPHPLKAGTIPHACGVSEALVQPPPADGIQFENFVDATVGAKYLSITRRQLLALARSGAVPAYPASLGSRRKQWRFRLSELSAAMTKGLKKPVNQNANRVDNGSRQSRSSRKGSS